jgi:hypothetical protein
MFLWVHADLVPKVQLKKPYIAKLRWLLRKDIKAESLTDFDNQNGWAAKAPDPDYLRPVESQVSFFFIFSY